MTAGFCLPLICLITTSVVSVLFSSPDVLPDPRWHKGWPPVPTKVGLRLAHKVPHRVIEVFPTTRYGIWVCLRHPHRIVCCRLKLEDISIKLKLKSIKSDQLILHGQRGYLKSNVNGILSSHYNALCKKVRMTIDSTVYVKARGKEGSREGGKKGGREGKREEGKGGKKGKGREGREG